MKQNIDLLPALFQTATLALLSASIPLAMTMTSTIIAINPEDDLLPNPSARDLSTASSVHVLAFSSLGDLLVVESEGEFSLNVWEKICTEARKICLGPEKERGDGGEEDVSMDEANEGEGKSLQGELRSAIERKVEKEWRWREGL